jgi:hypothetical protein
VGPLRIGNASGFYGDRSAAFREMLEGGPLDVLTGDYLAELTMLVLARDRQKDPALGYAKTFPRQLEQCLGTALERRVKIVTNAGGLNPAGLAEQLRELAARLGLDMKIAYVEGDDLLAGGAHQGSTHQDSAPHDGAHRDLAAYGLAEQAEQRGFLAANAYLGAFGIAACLRAGADVVVTGRVTDASLVVGPAAARFGWSPDDHDALAGAVVAGHVLECGAQATGGNFAFFREHDLRRPGFPIAEIHSDGSSVITKHPGTGGAVTVETVTAQLLYETSGPRYAGPDVTARLDTIRLYEDGPDRVRISGVRGEAPPPTLKTGLCRIGGWRNEVVFVLTGLDIEAKAQLVRNQMGDVLAKRPPAEVRWTLARTDRPDADVEEEASALLHLAVKDRDRAVAGRAVSDAAVQLALASYPGFHLTAPPSDAAPYGVFESAYVDAKLVTHTAVLPDGTRTVIPQPTRTAEPSTLPRLEIELPEPLPPGPTHRAPLGLVAGARSGDKGGDANVGVWARTEESWRWLAHALTVECFKTLLPETADLPVERFVLPNLCAVNFVVTGLLGEGVAAQARFDPQAKAVAEWLRARRLDIPESLL